MHRESDRLAASAWAYEFIHRSSWCVIDTETTGLDGTAEIVEIAVVDPNGQSLLNTRVRPTASIPSAASNVHGICSADVADAPTFDRVLVPLLQAVGNREIVIYNASFDVRVIYQSLKAHGIYLPPQNEEVLGRFPAKQVTASCWRWVNGAPIHCAMEQYSRFVGEWNSYHGNYRWQRLPDGDHSALGDCRATLQLIHRMAAEHCEAEAARG